ncbi:MAG: hypothetical protein ACXVEV_00960 [Nocardioidaceae bacterium]
MVRFRVDDSVAEDDGAVVWPVYESVFGDYSDYETWRGAVWDKHSVRTGFRLARAYDADVLVGFAYGYTGEHGQCWTDNARKVLEPEVAEAWLGGHFESARTGTTTEVVAEKRRTHNSQRKGATCIDPGPRSKRPPDGSSPPIGGFEPSLFAA